MFAFVLSAFTYHSKQKKIKAEKLEKFHIIRKKINHILVPKIVIVNAKKLLIHKGIELHPRKRR